MPFLRSYSATSALTTANNTIIDNDMAVLAVADNKIPRISLPKLKAVDREYDIVELLWCAQDNLRTASDRGSKPYLPYSSHMFGAGKTTLGEKLMELLKEGEQRILPKLEERNVRRRPWRSLPLQR